MTIYTVESQNTRENKKMHNGFKNKATWLVSLHLNNTEVSATYWSNAARGEFVDNLADRLKNAFQNNALAEVVSPIFIDLLQSTLADVDWMTIAQHFVDGVTVEA